MAEPLRPPTGAANLGGAALARPTTKQWELGVVLTYDPHTHTSVVRTHRGRPLQNVPRIKSGPGDFDHLSTGTTVVVTWALGWPAILGVIDDVGLPQAAIPAVSLTGVEGVGVDDPTQPANGTNTYKPPGAPNDMGSGDWARVGKMGNHVAVLEGGVSLLGSPTAHVRSIGSSGTLQLVARRLQQITDFGKLSVENDQGKTSFVLRAGANQTTETGLDEQHWTIRLDLGATGDVLDFQICEPEGKTLFRLHAGADGRVQIYGDGGVDLSSGPGGTAELRHDVSGARVTAVDGNETHDINGGHVVTVSQSSTRTVGGDETHSVRGDVTAYAGGDRTAAVGGDETHVVGGARTSKIGGASALDVGEEWSVLARRDISLESHANVTIKAMQRARLDGASVVLGSQGAHPIPKFDVFLRDLSTFLQDLLGAIGALVPSNPLALAPRVAKIGFFAAKISAMAPYVSSKVSND